MANYMDANELVALKTEIKAALQQRSEIPKEIVITLEKLDLMVSHTAYLQRALRRVEDANVSLAKDVAAANQHALDLENNKTDSAKLTAAVGMLRKMAKANAQRNPDTVPVIVKFLESPIFA